MCRFLHSLKNADSEVQNSAQQNGKTRDKMPEKVSRFLLTLKARPGTRCPRTFPPMPTSGEDPPGISSMELGKSAGEAVRKQ